MNTGTRQASTEYVYHYTAQGMDQLRERWQAEAAEQGFLQGKAQTEDKWQTILRDLISTLYEFLQDWEDQVCINLQEIYTYVFVNHSNPFKS